MNQTHLNESNCAAFQNHLSAIKWRKKLTFKKHLEFLGRLDESLKVCKIAENIIK